MVTETYYERLEHLLKTRASDRAFRVNRELLEGVLSELDAIARIAQAAELEVERFRRRYELKIEPVKPTKQRWLWRLLGRLRWSPAQRETRLR